MLEFITDMETKTLWERRENIGYQDFLHFHEIDFLRTLIFEGCLNSGFLVEG